MLNDLVTLKRGRLSWFRYPTHNIGTYLGRGVMVLIVRMVVMVVMVMIVMVFMVIMIIKRDRTDRATRTDRTDKSEKTKTKGGRGSTSLFGQRPHFEPLKLQNGGSVSQYNYIL